MLTKVKLLNGLVDGIRVKFKGGKYYVDGTLQLNAKGQVQITFPYNAILVEAVKTRFEKRRWNPDEKCWTFPLTQRNLFQLQAITKCENPYDRWDQASKAVFDPKSDVYNVVKDYEACKAQQLGFDFSLYNHQRQMLALELLAKCCILGAEMGTGKTLAAIALMEILAYPNRDYMWIAPNTPLVAAKRDFSKWQCNIQPRWHKLDSFRRFVDQWEEGDHVPRVLVLDESSRCKTITAQRTVCVQWMCDLMRETYGDECYIIELSGRPATNSPIDWLAQTEIACPGFVTEANVHTLTARLALQEEGENPATGQAYKKIKTWLDDENKCQVCGKYKEHKIHLADHKFEKSVDEVSRFGKRLSGLVGIWFKKDCLDLPEKKYELIKVEPSPDLLAKAKMVVQTSTRAVDTLVRLQTLSDGFLYEETQVGTKPCEYCSGNGKRLEWCDPEEPWELLTTDEINAKMRDLGDGQKRTLVQQEIECPGCDGTGERPVMERQTVEIPSAKLDKAEELLDLYEESRRFVIYGYFTGTLDRLVKMCHRNGWATIRVDGKGWRFQNPKGEDVPIPADKMLQVFDNTKSSDFSKICFIGQSGAASMGITLTASLACLVYSNSFKLEDRIQLEDRIHRVGMDVLGGTIIDIVQLPSDLKVVQALKQKNDLSMLPMTGLKQLYGV